MTGRRTERNPDLLVIGGGAAGLAAARAGVRRGARTVLVQTGRLGGDCTFTGCVPSKTLIEAAARRASFTDALAAAATAVATVAAAEDDAVLRREGVEIVHGWATFLGPGLVDVDGVHFRPRHVVVATGARPAIPALPGLSDVDFLTTETVFDLGEQPSSLAVLGGGAIGCELAQAFHRLGTTVTIIESLDRILPQEDPAASAVIGEVFAREGIDMRTARTVETLEPLPTKGSVRLHLDDHTTIDARRLLVAVGRAGTTDGLGLAEAGVDVERGFVVTDETMATTAPSVWAAGDVTGRMQLTHAADEMGRIAAGNALGRGPRRRFRSHQMPSVIFTDPEVARVGAAEPDAGRRARVAYLPMSEVDRAIAAGATDGFVKLIAAPRPLVGNLAGGRLVGASIVSVRAGELIGEAALAVRTGMFVGRLAQTVHAYPTWATSLRQAAAQFFFEIGDRRARPASPDGNGGGAGR